MCPAQTSETFEIPDSTSRYDSTSATVCHRAPSPLHQKHASLSSSHTLSPISSSFNCKAKYSQSIVTGSPPIQLLAASAAATRDDAGHASRCRDLFGYVGLISLVAATPAIDWNGIGGNELSNIARLSYFTVVAIGSVYLGVRRQDIGETAPITGKSAALAPFIATATLGGLYLIIKYTALDPGTFYRGVACLFALLSTSELLQPLLGLAIAGELTPADYAFTDEREGDNG